MAVKCGRCRNLHLDSKAVMACYNGEKVAVVDAGQQAAYGRAMEPTDKQWNFLNSLRAQCGLPRLPDEHRSQQTRRTISEAINDAQIDVAQAKRDGTWVPPENYTEMGSRFILAEDYAGLVAGSYALPCLTGSNDLDFIQVDIPTEGSWKGKVFVKQVIGGSDPQRVPKAKAEAWLKRLSEPGAAVAAMATYGREMGRCGKCGRTLTDEESRARGIGPVCAEQMG